MASRIERASAHGESSRRSSSSDDSFCTALSHISESPRASRSSEQSASSSFASPSHTMAYNVSFSPAPHMELFDSIMGEQVGGQDTWITLEHLQLDRDIPGIPPAYAKEEAEQRVIYVKGIPNSWLNGAFAYLISRYGRVVKCPILISLSSEETFRWAIMGTAEEAMKVLDMMHEMPFHGNRLTVSMASKPGPTMRLSMRRSHDPTGGTFTAPPPVPGMGSSTVHGHPPPTPQVRQEEKSKENIPPVATRPPSPVVHTNAVVVPRDLTPSKSTAASTSVATPALIPAPASTSAAPPPTTTSPDSYVSVAASWASIAGAANPSTNVVDLHPRNRSASGHRLNPIGRIPTVVRTGPVESQAEQMRLVFLLNLPNNITLQDISNSVREGPIVKILFGHDEEEKTRFSGVVFQHARDAETFHSVLVRERLERRPDRFRFIVDCVRGDAFPADETIRAMGDSKINASRRLTMVKKGFFFAVNERKLTNLLHKMVGEEKVQLVWLYNGGNATVVFSDVAAAMKVKAELDRIVSEAGAPDGQPAIWANLQISFSKDPCQVPLELKTAITS